MTALAYSDALILGVGTQTGQVCANSNFASLYIFMLCYLFIYSHIGLIGILMVLLVEGIGMWQPHHLPLSSANSLGS